MTDSLCFASDNWAGAHPAVVEAIAAANHGPAAPYGEDPWTQRVAQRVCDIFETDCAVFPVTTGSAANGLGLSLLTPPYGVIFTHEAAHIQTDECGLPELYTGGAKIIPLPGEHGRIDANTLQTAITGFGHGPPHAPPPSAVSITQSTETGSVYRADEVAALSAVTRAHGMRLHMDGARFANALVSPVSAGASPADLSWRAGVDVLSFGGTKNGALAAELVVIFDSALIRDFEYRRKRAGQLWSKMRFLSAQFDALLAGDLWLTSAAHANAMARALADGLSALPGVELGAPVEANAVFAAFPEGVADAMRAEGAAFYPWATPGDRFGGRLNRFVTSWATQASDVDALLHLAKAALNTSGIA